MEAVDLGESESGELLADRVPESACFSVEYRIRASDIDQDMRLRLDGIGRYLQDVANDNLRASSCSLSDPFWIVRRTVIDVLQPISWPGTVKLERWCSSVSTRWANMRVRLVANHETDRLNPNERPQGLIETEAFWINVNEQGLPTRISDDGFELLSSTTDQHRLRWRSMHTSIAPDPDEEGIFPDRLHPLRSTDFDPFRHVNNSSYWVVLEDELTEHPDLVRKPHRAVIEYHRPIAPGAQITVRRRRKNNTLSVWMIVDNQVTTTATVSEIDL
ncbi:MAG: acyl-[acyl-carrier-protein] thioesterase [Mycobacteriaceae bacterium]